MTRPWASGRKTLWFFCLWISGTWHMLRAQHMLGDWVVVGFSGCEQTFEDVASIPYFTCFLKGWPYCVCWDMPVAPSTGHDLSCLCCSFLPIASCSFSWRAGSLIMLCYFDWTNTHLSLKLRVKCHLPDFVIWISCTHISAMLCTDCRGINCLAVLNCLLAWLSVH